MVSPGQFTQKRGDVSWLVLSDMQSGFCFCYCSPSAFGIRRSQMPSRRIRRPRDGCPPVSLALAFSPLVCSRSESSQRDSSRSAYFLQEYFLSASFRSATSQLGGGFGLRSCSEIKNRSTRWVRRLHIRLPSAARSRLGSRASWLDHQRPHLGRGHCNSCRRRCCLPQIPTARPA